MGSWFLSDRVVLPNPKEYSLITDEDVDEVIREEGETLWRGQEVGTIDVDVALPQSRQQTDMKLVPPSSDGYHRDPDDSDGI